MLRKPHRTVITKGTNANPTRQEKSKATAFKSLIENGILLLSLVWRLGLLYGGFWLFFYCFFVIRFFPASVTPADGLFLIAIALGFGLLIAFLGGMGFFICKPLLEQTAQNNDQSNTQKYITEPTPTKYRSRTTTLILAFSIILQILLCLLYHESTKPNPETTTKAISEFINESPFYKSLFSYAFLIIPFAVYPICSFIIFRFGLKTTYGVAWHSQQ